MDITPLIAPHMNVITKYRPGAIAVNGQWLEGSSLITPHHREEWTTPFERLTREQLSSIREQYDLDILLIGIDGLDSAELIARAHALASPHYALELQSIAAACRSYTVLLTEGRDVACLVLYG